MSWWNIFDRLDRLERAVILLARFLKLEQREIEAIEKELKPTHYPKTVGVSVKAS